MVATEVALEVDIVLLDLLRELQISLVGLLHGLLLLVLAFLIVIAQVLHGPI